MTHEQWGKEIEEVPKIYDGSSKHVHSRIFVDWTAERDKLRELLQEVREIIHSASYAAESSLNPADWCDALLELEKIAKHIGVALEEKP